jgi:2'-5' RNA ligase
MAQHRPPKPLRLFIAATPPVDWRERALALAGGEAWPAHKTTAIDQLHLTVLFLGERRPSLLPDIIESITAAAKGLPKIALTPQKFIALPEKGPARLVAIETQLPNALDELQWRLVQRLVRADRTPTKFRPHLTLLRFAGAGVDRGTLPRPPAVDALGSFDVTELHLISSVLHPLGARHRIEATIPVGTSQRNPLA